jgi:hypothetical protein
LLDIGEMMANGSLIGSNRRVAMVEEAYTKLPPHDGNILSESVRFNYCRNRLAPSGRGSVVGMSYEPSFR